MEATAGEGRRRVVIESLSPAVDGGRFPVKRTVGEEVTVTADVFADGHDELAAILLYRSADECQWRKRPMKPLLNDRWEGSFIVGELGTWLYTVEGRIDPFATWRRDLRKKFEAGLPLKIDLLIGAELLEKAAERAGEPDKNRLLEIAGRLRDPKDEAEAVAVASEEEVARLTAIYYDPELSTFYEGELSVTVERRKAVFSTWYEFFPRSCCGEGKNHGTFADCEKLLPRIAGMGFDVVYFPPIHPIGRTHRKGKNNAPAAAPNDPGCPWAIGSSEGGHRSVHPDLGTMEDFDRFVAKAAEEGIEVALDLAFQCSPDHPMVADHPEWFRWRPDGTVQFAENPPKRYEDIVPFDFESEGWRPLWEELKDIIRFWVGHGVTIFRVDNPHTKPFAFWQWTIAEMRREHPEVLFLSEAFTRPKVMYRLAKAGFSQSYTYFCWRHSKKEIEEYLAELCAPPLSDFFRPNFWPNTPDILPEFLQYGGAPAFAIRLILAATLSSNYGIYGPPFDLCLGEALQGKEEYLDSEKYEIRSWDWEDPRNLRDLIALINRIRRENPALQETFNLRFCETDNDSLLCYLKRSGDLSNLILTVVSLDPFNAQSGKIRVPLEELGIPHGQPFLAHDQMGDRRWIWQSEWNPIEIDPRSVPAVIFRLHPRLRREQDFDYYF